MNVKDIIELIKNSIINETKFFLHKDMMLIGENTSGKSNIIKGAIKALNYQGVYFIDSRNRVVPTKGAIIGDEFGKYKASEIIKCRLKQNNFNKRDMFSDDSEGEVILGELIKNRSKYIQLFKETLNIDMIHESTNSFVQDEVEQIYINNTSLSEISSGIQSKLRILMEVNFANENQCNVVFIDEFNSNLDYKASTEFFISLRNRYPNIRFIITSHDIYTLRGITDTDVVKIYKEFEEPEANSCEIFDINDLDNLESIDRKLFGGVIGRTQKDEKDIFLGNALKLLLSKKSIEPSVTIALRGMMEEELTLRQKAVRNYILERLK